MSLLARYGAVVALLAACYQSKIDSWIMFLLAFGLWTLLGGYYTLYLIIYTLPRDLM